MRLVKRITCVCLKVVPKIFCSNSNMFFCVVNKLIFKYVKLFSIFFLSNDLTNLVSLNHCHSTKYNTSLHNLFLIQYTSVSILQVIIHRWMNVLNHFSTMLASNIRLANSIHSTWTNKSVGCNKFIKVTNSHFDQKIGIRSCFTLEYTLCTPLRQHLKDFFIV